MTEKGAVVRLEFKDWRYDMDKGKKRPFALYVLVFLLFFEAVAALYGGFSLVFDPTGALLKIGDEVLVNSPFSSFLIPGLILGVVLGLLPMLLIYPLLALPPWKWAHRLNIYKNQN